MKYLDLDKKYVKNVSKKLNDLLANYQIYYQNLRGFHWNIKGRNFFELHLKYEEFYNESLLHIDEIAERILTLGSSPLHSFSDYLKHAEIKEKTACNTAVETVNAVLDNLQILLKSERDIFKLANNANDDATAAIMNDYIKIQEKTAWMLSSWLHEN